MNLTFSCLPASATTAAEKMEMRAAIRNGFKNGLRKGWDGFVWMIQIIVPVSFLTSLLAWSGWLREIDFIVQPLMNAVSLPAMAALPLVIGMFAGIYGAIAAMAVLPMNQTEMTLVAIFALMAHNLIQEGIIQARSGIHPFKATVFRLVAACLTVMAVAALMGYVPSGEAAAAAGPVPARGPLGTALLEWLVATVKLSAIIFVVIMALLSVLEIMKSLGWIHPIVRACAPILRLMGLNEKVGILWMTAIVFGLSYGGAVIVEEARQGHLTREDLETLHLSIGMNHSMVEDPSYFIALGLNPLWLYLPRLVAAILTVWLIRLWYRLSGQAPRFS
ncbi:MAG: iron transporter [Syntrophales bacterium]